MQRCGGKRTPDCAKGSAVLRSITGLLLPCSARPRHFIASLLCAVTALMGTSARADLDLQGAAGPGVSWIRTMPSLKSTQTSTYARDLNGHDVPIGGSVT